MNKTTPARLLPLDALRGLIIVFMALDHANYFIAQQHSSGEHWGGAFPSYISALPALTRFITHLSAPGFFFLMGVGMMLFSESRRKKGWGTWKIIGHFWIRGTVLVLLQFFVVNYIWKAGPQSFPEIYIGVLVALGGTMMLGSFFLGLKPFPLLLLTLGLLIGTEMLHPSPDMWGKLTMDAPNLLIIRSGGDGTLWSNYPILPWLELVIFGFLFGHWLLTDETDAYKKGFWTGIGLLVLFTIIRYFDGFGNIRPRAGDSWIDWLNVVKYPPSMAFTFLTMGINLILLWGLSRDGNPLTGSGLGSETASRLLVPFGGAPLFVYVTHLALYMLMGRILASHGMSIPAMLPYWIIGLVILYPLARWYRSFKHSQNPLRWITAYL